MKIESYSFGSMKVSGQMYKSDLIVFPDHINAGWRRKDGHKLNSGDLKEVMECQPEILVVGRGFLSCMKVLKETKKTLEERNIRVVEKRTGKAYPLFNEYLNQGKKVVGVFHLTC